MQNWDRNRQDVKFKQKLNNVKSTLPKISYANNSGPSIIAKKSSNPQNNQNLNNLENLYINVTYKMKQGPNSSGGQSSSSSTATPQSQGGSIPSITKGKSKDMKRQNYLKHLLNEFGLSQYLRKLYELGYDDNNINKIGLMSRKKYQTPLALESLPCLSNCFLSDSICLFSSCCIWRIDLAEGLPFPGLLQFPCFFIPLFLQLPFCFFC